MRDTQTKVARVLSEDILSITEARESISRVFKKRPDKSTVIRWITSGKLDGVRLGRAYYTSSQAITRMVQAHTPN